MNCENAIMNRENAIMNQLPSEIFLLRSVSFLIKLFCKKLPPSLVKCVFLLQCYTRQVKISNVHLNFFLCIFAEAKSWTSKSDSIVFNSLGCKFFCLSGEIQLASGKVKARENFCCLLLFCRRVGKWRWRYSGDDFQKRCLSQSTGSLSHVVKFLPLKLQRPLAQEDPLAVAVAVSSHPRTVLYPGAHPPTNRSFRLFSFVSFVLSFCHPGHWFVGIIR